MSDTFFTSSTHKNVIERSYNFDSNNYFSECSTSSLKYLEICLVTQLSDIFISKHFGFKTQVPLKMSTDTCNETVHLGVGKFYGGAGILSLSQGNTLTV